MKKLYNKPEINIFQTNLEDIMSASTFEVEGVYDPDEFNILD